MKFALVFEENCSYGFRRNLWGMKPAGLFFSAVGLLLAAAVIIVQLRAHHAVSAVSYTGAACIIALLLFWLTWCSSDWVKLSADAFAERLMASIETLGKNVVVRKKAAAKSNRDA
jgi:hypothetical protein